MILISQENLRITNMAARSPSLLEIARSWAGKYQTKTWEKNGSVEYMITSRKITSDGSYQHPVQHPYASELFDFDLEKYPQTERYKHLPHRLDARVHEETFSTFPDVIVHIIRRTRKFFRGRLVSVWFRVVKEETHEPESEADEVPDTVSAEQESAALEMMGVFDETESPEEDEEVVVEEESAGAAAGGGGGASAEPIASSSLVASSEVPKFYYLTCLTQKSSGVWSPKTTQRLASAHAAAWRTYRKHHGASAEPVKTKKELKKEKESKAVREEIERLRLLAKTKSEKPKSAKPAV